MKHLEARMDSLVETFKSQPWQDAGFYKEWLAQTYYYVRYSTRMLGLAVARTPPSDVEYFKRTVNHIAEENNHEKLALTDLKRLDGNIADYPEMGVTRAFYEPQFYKTDKNPYALLGYILALELLSSRVPPELMTELKKQYGDKCCTFLHVHVTEDQEHVEQAWKMFAAVPEDKRDDVEKNYIQSCDMYQTMLEACARKSASHSGHRKGHQAA